MPCFLVAVVLLCGCGAVEGEVIYEHVGGWCDGGCDARELRRDGDALHWVEEEGRRKKVSSGRWTDEGLGEYIDASLAVHADLPLQLDTCAAADGIDALVTLEDPEGEPFQVQYCELFELPPSMERVHVLFRRTITALRDRTPDPFVAL